MNHVVLALVLLAGSSVAQSAPPPADNARLAAIYQEDQQVRQKMPIDWSVVAPLDRAHRTEVLDLLRNGKVITAKDYVHAAMVFQHGDTSDDHRMAFGLSHIAATLDPSIKMARWLSAASWDRILKGHDVPQWYGTQYHQPTPGGPTALYKVDESAVSDEERARMNVPTLQEAKDLLLQINKK